MIPNKRYVFLERMDRIITCLRMSSKPINKTIIQKSIGENYVNITPILLWLTNNNIILQTKDNRDNKVYSLNKYWEGLKDIKLLQKQQSLYSKVIDEIKNVTSGVNHEQ